MPFLLPGKLVDFEYFSSDNSDEERAKEAKPYQKEIDFAFFAANFGYSKADYEAITPKERAFILKAWEDKSVMESSLVYNAVYTATYNLNRKKNKRPLKLWRKNPTKKADMEVVHDNLSIAKQVDKKEGRSWVEKIYAANGLLKKNKKKTKRREKDG